jgi:hypothetical protein
MLMINIMLLVLVNNCFVFLTQMSTFEYHDRDNIFVFKLYLHVTMYKYFVHFSDMVGLCNDKCGHIYFQISPHHTLQIGVTFSVFAMEWYRYNINIDIYISLWFENSRYFVNSFFKKKTNILMNNWNVQSKARKYKS